MNRLVQKGFTPNELFGALTVGTAAVGGLVALANNSFWDCRSQVTAAHERQIVQATTHWMGVVETVRTSGSWMENSGVRPRLVA